MKGTEGDCGWGRVQKEGLAKTGVKRLADFSGWAESGDDTDRVEKEDVTSEVVERVRGWNHGTGFLSAHFFLEEN